MGSGTTLRAAKDLARRAIGVDVSPRYCAMSADRCRQQLLFAAELPAADQAAWTERDV
jgi:DNA modification methylase